MHLYAIYKTDGERQSCIIHEKDYTTNIESNI